jgi:hypothetical protein
MTGGNPMEKKSDDFSMQEAMRIAQSDAGRQLLAHLQETNRDQLDKAMAQAAAGNYAEVQKTLASLMNTPQVRAMLERLKE